MWSKRSAGLIFQLRYQFIKSKTSYQALTKNEREILERLLEADFTGRDQIRQQFNNCLVTIIDEYGSLRFDIRSDIEAHVIKRVPIEAEAQDVDGVLIHLLLHVVDGKLTELEIYKDDSSPIAQMPEASRLRLVRLE